MIKSINDAHLHIFRLMERVKHFQRHIWSNSIVLLLTVDFIVLAYSIISSQRVQKQNALSNAISQTAEWLRLFPLN